MSVADVVGGLPNDTWECEDLYYEHAGLRLHYIDARRRDRAAADPRSCVVMLHGMTAHCDAWRSMIMRFDNASRVICPDFRGHGLSQWTTDGYWLADYAADVLALVDLVDEPRIDLVGHSLGARVAMVLAPMLGGRLRSLVLSDTGPEVSKSAAQQALSINSSAKSVAGFRDQAALRAFLREQQPDWGDEAIDIRAERLYRVNWAGMLVNRGDPEVTWLLGRAGLREVDAMWSGLRSVEVPVMILRATKSFLLDEELMQRMQAAVQRSVVVRFDLGHYLPYEDPDAVARALDGFVADPEAFSPS